MSASPAPEPSAEGWTPCWRMPTAAPESHGPVGAALTIVSPPLPSAGGRPTLPNPHRLSYAGLPKRHLASRFFLAELPQEPPTHKEVEDLQCT